jgi:outer membrane lipoprotein-sorting protein
MNFLRLSGLIASLAVLGAAPSAARDLPGEFLAPPRNPDGVLALAPQIGATPAQRFTLTPAPLPPTFQTFSQLIAAAARGMEPPRESEPSSQHQPQPGPAAAALPPPAPLRLSGGHGPEPGPQPILTASAPPHDVEIARPEPLSKDEVVNRANAYFSDLGSLIAEFTQVGGDGRRLRGMLYLQRPGKVRFEYEPPATLEVIADGSSVAVRDKKLATQDLYSISQTPLKFLLREKVNLGRDIRITGVEQDGDSVRLALEDRSTLGGTSQITLYFDPAVEQLTQWRITDPQGFQTTVLLDKLDRTKQLDQSLFAISYDRVINTDNVSR